MEIHSVWVPTDSAGFYTLVLALFTGVLAGVSIFQGVMLIRSDRTARIIAEAAKKSSDAAYAAERGRFFIVIDENNVQDILSVFQFNLVGGSVTRSTPPTITYRFKNYGKTFGIVRTLKLGMAISADPVDAAYSSMSTPFAENMIGASDFTETKRFSLDSNLEDTQANAIRSNKTRLWFFGRLEYEDAFGQAQVHRFYFRTAASNDNCVLEPYDFKDFNKST